MNANQWLTNRTRNQPLVVAVQVAAVLAEAVVSHRSSSSSSIHSPSLTLPEFLDY